MKLQGVIFDLDGVITDMSARRAAVSRPPCA